MFRTFFRYIRYKIRGQHRFSVHSPFLFAFIRDVLQDSRYFYAFDEIESVRDAMLRDDRLVRIQDLGAGSKKLRSDVRKISDIARSALVSAKFGRMLFRMASYFGSQSILELGTSLGISTLYLASANKGAQVITLEGSTAIAEVAKENFVHADAENITLLTGEFSETLPHALSRFTHIDLAFIDGNHAKAPTLLYFEKIVARCTPESVIILDDIHWSREMEEAWRTILQHPAVTLSIDLFFKGIVFLRRDFHEKQHIILSY